MSIGAPDIAIYENFLSDEECEFIKAAVDGVGDEHPVPILRVALAVCPDHELRDRAHRLDGLSFAPGVDEEHGLTGEVGDGRPLVVGDGVRHVVEDRGAWVLAFGVAVDVLSSRRALWTC